ncbi:Cysteine--tRNA ligase [Seminavis robusta]|uniref:cysteine--tRNA ligase n=1 Tax=Seminavis robusta TaxID=568900 RepID=A0A9N8DD23_9STRA|nr:Cysteine--tRNA ligase [Seminavis robusta]|eukprot:Sro91_g047640.1 Cysteine--tRNA ligase (595) ;mRNA; f:40874-42658
MPLLSLSKTWILALTLVPTLSVEAWTLPSSQLPARTRSSLWIENDPTQLPISTSHQTLSKTTSRTRRRKSRASLLYQSATQEDATNGALVFPEITLYNSLTRQKETLSPLQKGQFSMYTCGPTVYDYAHVGNFRAFLTYDVLKRALQYFGYTVTHICNLTDVDDKIIQRATELGLESALELTQKFERLFRLDLHALNIVPADGYPRATDHVEEMMDMIATLHDKELAYETADGSWYFRTQAQEGYGQQLVQFSSQASEEYNAEQEGLATVNEDGKEHFQDFCLWKAYKPGVDRDDLVWERPPLFQKGRPGWHLECSAMAQKYLGDTIDLHGGGVDLKFPHHENEIAQSQGCTGKTFCNCWFHNGFVNINSEKMSKSLGNFLTLTTACPSAVDVRAYRYLVVSSQYRNPLNFSPDAMKAAKSALKRIDAVQTQLTEALKDAKELGDGSDSKIAQETVPKALQNFEAALLDDLSMPRAAASLFGLVKAAEKELKRVAKNDDASLDLPGLAAIQSALEQMDKVFGIFYDVPDTHASATEKEDDSVVPEEVMELVSQRTAAKESKDWELADSLRARITELGFAVKDVKGGEPLVSRLD